MNPGKDAYGKGKGDDKGDNDPWNQGKGKVPQRDSAS